MGNWWLHFDGKSRVTIERVSGRKICHFHFHPDELLKAVRSKEVSGCFGLKEIFFAWKRGNKMIKARECYQEEFGGSRPDREPVVVS